MAVTDMVAPEVEVGAFKLKIESGSPVDKMAVGVTMMDLALSRMPDAAQAGRASCGQCTEG